MKCLSKTIIKYKREQQEAERHRREEEKLSKMTPEERKAYEEYKEEQRKKAMEALAFFDFAKAGFNRSF